MTRTDIPLFSMLTGLMLILGGCANNNAVVQKGILQQRKYVKPGWFVDLGSRDRIDRSATTPRQLTLLRTRRAPEPPQVEAAGQDPAFAEAQDTLPPNDTTEHGMTVDQEGDEGPVEASAGTKVTLDQGSAKTGMDLRPIDPGTAPFLYAPASTDDVGGVDIFALLGFIFAFFFPVAGIVLSAIGLHRTRGGGHGHGLALAGLIIGIVFLIVFGAVLL